MKEEKRNKERGGEREKERLNGDLYVNNPSFMTGTLIILIILLIKIMLMTISIVVVVVVKIPLINNDYKEDECNNDTDAADDNN